MKTVNFESENMNLSVKTVSAPPAKSAPINTMTAGLPMEAIDNPKAQTIITLKATKMTIRESGKIVTGNAPANEASIRRRVVACALTIRFAKDKIA